MSAIEESATIAPARSQGFFILSGTKEIQKLVRECRLLMLQTPELSLSALITLASGLLPYPGNKLPFEMEEIPETVRKKVFDCLAIYQDWHDADATILGLLYESLLDAVEGDVSKQGRRRKSGIFYTPSHITEFLVKSALDACSDSLKKDPP